MRIFNVLFASVWLGVLGLVPAAAATLFDNAWTAPRGGHCKFECMNVIGAENFTLPAAASIDIVTFETWFHRARDGSGVTVDWTLRNDAGSRPGAVVGSGVGLVPILANLGAIDATYDRMSFSVDIADTLLGAGNFWLTLRLNAPNGRRVYFWARTDDGDSLSAHSHDGGQSWIAPYATGTRGFVFGVQGTPSAAVPLPAALPLLATGLGLLAALGARRRRQG